MSESSKGLPRVQIGRTEKEYDQQGLDESRVAPDPMAQFAHWYQDAADADILDANAMTLATASPDGKPSARTVLLKAFDARGFVFYTNYDSAKGRELTENPYAALVFYWAKLSRQVRVTGVVSKVSGEESRHYFRTRPVGSRLAAWASPQSEVIVDREELERWFHEAEARFGEDDIPLPPFWGGFRVAPDSVEFWQGRPDRLHDRLRYRYIGPAQWRVDRLAP